MIVLMTGQGKPEALDRVGDESNRPIVKSCRFEGIHQQREIMTAEIAHQARQLLVRAPFDEGAHHRLVSQIVEEPTTPSGSALERQSCIELVRTIVDPSTKGLAARFPERGFCSDPCLRITTSQPKLQKSSSNRAQRPSRMMASRLCRL